MLTLDKIASFMAKEICLKGWLIIAVLFGVVIVIGAIINALLKRGRIK